VISAPRPRNWQEGAKIWAVQDLLFLIVPMKREEFAVFVATMMM
jgi:hypothetical protein